MVAKYRPAVPVMTLVVPYLKRDGLRWKLEGRSTARQALLTSGLLPIMAAPTPSGEGGRACVHGAPRARVYAGPACCVRGRVGAAAGGAGAGEGMGRVQ